MYQKIHRWVDLEEEDILPEDDETQEAPRDHYDFELEVIEERRPRENETEDE
jgi:hypothetical protein